MIYELTIIYILIYRLSYIYIYIHWIPHQMCSLNTGVDLCIAYKGRESGLSLSIMLRGNQKWRPGLYPTVTFLQVIEISKIIASIRAMKSYCFIHRI